jgi:putative endopeptidase
MRYSSRFVAIMAFAVGVCLSAASQTGQSSQGTQTQKKPASTQSAHKTAPKPAASTGLNNADFDRSCKPCDDFDKFVNGGWVAANPIPAAYPAWGRMNMINDHNQDVLHEILEAAAKTPGPEGSVGQKIGDFYAACMDTAKIDADGIRPLDDELARIAKISDVASLEAEIARLQGMGVRAAFAFGSTIDFKNSSEQTGEAGQGGIALPDRDYYTKTDDRSKQLRDAYVAHVTKMFTLAGDPADRASAEAATIMKMETAFAEASMTRVERRDPNAQYHRMGTDELKALSPNFDWEAYFQDIGFPGIRVVNVAQPKFIQQLDASVKDTPLDDWKVYLRWQLIHAAAPSLSQPFVDENFAFFGTALTGAKEQLPRWKRCVGATDRELGEALGQKYVEKAFPPAYKARALEMVHNLIDALRADLETLDWMSAPTKAQALAKLNAITLKIGYPDKWIDYSAYHVVRSPYMEDVLRGNEFRFHRDLAKIGQPVDRTEWGMTPPTVNAYYNPQFNEVVFPAGILQPPAFDGKYDDALNYGAMGAVIGHELTHGFDDEGRQFDAQGNLRDWWTPEDSKNFDERAMCIQKEFDSFVVEGDLHENGKLELGEAIADLGGLVIAHAAFQKTPEAKTTALKDGFTPDQRFFIAYARVWGGSMRPEMQRLLAQTDEHPLARFRVMGALSNMPPFAAAFGCKAGDPMVRSEADRCRIW